jgi:excinuclease ABC subunit C
MVANVFDALFIHCQSDHQTHILENQLIQIHKPKYNIKLKYRNNIYYIHYRVNENFPKLHITNHVDNEKKYLGPFTTKQEANFLIKIIESFGKLRSCNQFIFDRRVKPCIKYQLNQCSAPCVNYVKEAVYQSNLNDLFKLIRDHNTDVIQAFEKKIHKSLLLENYENAEVYKISKSRLSSKNKKNKNIEDSSHVDIFLFGCDGKTTVLYVFCIRFYKVIYHDRITVYKELDDNNYIIDQFVMQYYVKFSKFMIKPMSILSNVNLTEFNLLKKSISGLLCKEIRIDLLFHTDYKMLFDLVSDFISEKDLPAIKHH